MFTLIQSRDVAFPEAADPAIVSLIRGLLAKDPRNRFAFEQVHEEPFFDGVVFQDLLEKKVPIQFVPEITDVKEPSNFDSEFTSESALDSFGTPPVERADFDGFSFVGSHFLQPLKPDVPTGELPSDAAQTTLTQDTDPAIPAPQPPATGPGPAVLNPQEAAVEIASPQQGAVEIADRQGAAVEIANPQLGAVEIADRHKAAVEIANPQEAAVEIADCHKAAVEIANPQEAAVEIADRQGAAVGIANPQDAATDLVARQELVDAVVDVPGSQDGAACGGGGGARAGVVDEALEPEPPPDACDG
jgi:hypothetical protein